jgi:putative chitinase
MEVQQLSEATGIDLAHAQMLIEGVNTAITQADLSNSLRLASFLGQCAHESDGFKFFEENLNYRAESLCRTWPSHFNVEIAPEYAHKPEKIANRAYANRGGNGSEESGDGWSFRGRGALQITFKANYEECSRDLGIDFVSNPDIVATPEGAFVTAGWFWTKHGLNHYADNQDWVGMTKKINGGTIGLEQRIARIERALQVLG